MSKEFLGVTAITLTFIAYLPYIRDIQRGSVKPHVFSWVIWGLTTTIVFFAQLADKGGSGAWPTGVSGAITIYVAGLAYVKKSDDEITRADWLFFVAAMSALPLWYITDDPLSAVLILTSVDLLGFAPTFRKAWYEPFEEQLTFFVLMSAKYIISLFALAHYSLTTMVFPLSVALACICFIIMTAWRRRLMTY